MEKENKKATPSKELVLRFENNSYTIKFPKTGEFISIEEKKGRYGTSITFGDASSYYARLLVNTIATFEVLIPSLVKDLNIKDIFETDLIFAKKLMKAYTEQYLPWYDSWMNILSDFEDVVEE